jgi:tRNA pseudouridine55 synthase
LLIGRATRLARFVEQQPKTYLATARLGWRTTTDDRTGEDAGPRTSVADLSTAELADAIEHLAGEQKQVPPAFSAKKVAGERSYRRARRGEEVTLPAVSVSVHQVSLIEIALPLVTFRVTVSPGTYIRALARDLGDRLNVGGHLEALRRESIGSLRVEEAVPLDRLVDASAIRPVSAVLDHLDRVELSEKELDLVRHGRSVERESDGSEHQQLVYQGRVAAVARKVGAELKPVVVLEPS